MNSLNPDIFLFFSDLHKNNSRNWFKHQKNRFKGLESSVKEFAEEVKNKILLKDLVDKVKLFRIYRDVRFSKDKTPYKTHFGISIHRVKPLYRGGYYIQIMPGSSFIACGFWNPNKEDLLRIRKEFEIDISDFKKIIEDPSFLNIWGGIEGEEVKTAPRGFSKYHKNINLIKKKTFLFIKKYNDNEVLSKDFMNNILNDFTSIRPFFDYMSNVLTTDLNGVSIFD
tara:strand:- start:41 stop:715 length:675 start_codon:yes stop_codon:yes gene_type:complete